MAGEWCDRNDHPLLNDVILSTVFECVRPTDLKECRVACKKWNVSTIPFTRKTWTVKIFGNESSDLEFMFINKKLLDARRIGKFIEVFSLNQLGIPFARFQLGAFSMTDVVGQQFLRLCGEIAMEIDLSLRPQVVMVEDVSELLRSTPNLVHFEIPVHLRSNSKNIVKLFHGPENSKPKLQFLKKLKFSHDYPESRIKFCPSFLEELFRAATNISNVSLGYSFHHGDLEVKGTTSLEVLTIIEKLGRELFIETIDFSSIEEKHVEILLRMKSNGMKLKEVKVFNNPERINQVATMFEDTLENFRAEFGTGSWSLKLPKMLRLRFLGLRIYGTFDLKLSNLNYMFPALEKLELVQSKWHEEYDEIFCESDPCPKMKSFKISNLRIKLKSFNRTLSIFPNLTELNLDVETNGSVFRCIWNQMTQLEILTLTGSIHTSENVDSIVTGISAESLHEVEQLVNELEKMTREVRRETILRLRNEHSLLPSIADLTNLRRLEFCVISKAGVGYGQTYLTDLTGYLGFYGMMQLRYLKIDRSKLTKSCCEILSTDLSLLSWTFRGVYYSHIIPEMLH